MKDIFGGSGFTADSDSAKATSSGIRGSVVADHRQRGAVDSVDGEGPGGLVSME